MTHVLLTLAALSALFSTTVFASCPDFLNHSMRKLASTQEIQFCEAYEGKALLIVNTASYCGYTSQFESLEKVHQTYAGNGLVVLGFSSDDFFQEDNDEGDAAEVCFEKYDMTFPVIATSAVRGSDANPVFRGVKPDSEEMRAAIEAALPAAQS